MDFKEKLHSYMLKIKSLWKTGKIQRSSRITYDVVWNIILFFLVIGFIGTIFVGAMGAGYFASLVKDEPIRSYETMAQDIYNYSETSKLYFADNVYIGDISSDLHREETTLEDISPILLQAVIATEDQNFEEHKGIVPKSILRATFQEFTNASVQTGGSTLTQQLIKNQILTNEVSFERKAVEILLALRLEQFFDKDEILEAYLNIIPYGRDSSGRNIAGVQTAAQGIFGINANEVNLPQAAYLAGLPQSPSAYTPFVNTGGLKDEEGIQAGVNRMKTVLSRMYEMDYITKEQYDEAVNYDIAADFIEEKQSPIEKYPVLTVELQKRATDVLTEVLAEQDGYTTEDLSKDESLKEDYRTEAERALEMNGYEIHSTINKDMYDAFQEIGKNYENYGRNNTYSLTDDETGETTEITEKVQGAGMLIENSTGRIISFFGNREPSIDNHFNYATSAVRSSGSTIKPLLVYAPAMEKGAAQPGTPIADYPKTFPGYSKPPTNYGGGNYGMVSARQALTQSYNIPALDTYMKIINDDPAKEYLEKMGITTLSEVDHVNSSLALGGMSNGISVEENVNAFSTFGNNGKFSDAYMIEKITTKDGEIVYEHKTEPVDVFTAQTNYLTIDMMRDVISNGTASYLNSQLNRGGVDWAGKTGTSNEYKDAWFVATNPNVTFGTWIGYDSNESIYDPSHPLSYSQRNIKLWAEFINAATDIDPELMAPSGSFERPDGIVERSYCSISGMLPSELCSDAGLVKTDLFNAKFVPTKVDDSLTTAGSTVMVNGKTVAAGSNTPSEFISGEGLTFNPAWLERTGYNNLSDLSVLYPSGADGEKWRKISVPSGKSGNSITNDKKAPGAPTSVQKSGNKLTWKKPGSKDVVGYRIYRSSEPGGTFELIGNTTSTEFAIGNGNAVYIVKAVDYFGMESKASKEVMVGETPEATKEKPDAQEEENNKPKQTEETEKPTEQNDTEATEEPNEESVNKQDNDKPANENSTENSEE